MKVSLLLPLALLPMSFALPNSLSRFLKPRQNLEAATDALLFDDTMAEFQSARNSQNPSGLDWISDNCSNSPDNPLGFQFTPSCQRHDFGYRNYKKQKRFTGANKAEIDLNFKDDLYDECAKYGDDQDTCEDTADVYYDAVRLFGKRKREAIEMVA